MEGETSWINDSFDDVARDIGEFDSFSELSDEGSKESNVVSVDLILPDDLLERILAYLPIASIFRAGSVCKRWRDIVCSRRFLWNFSHVLSQKPWYFMFTSSDKPVGYAYDPILRKWYGIDLPCIGTSSWFIASSRGLVCFMDNDSRSDLYVCNPITKCCKKLEEPPGLKIADYSALAISVNRMPHGYTVSVVKSKQVPGNFSQWDLSIYAYDSETRMWVASWSEVFTGWRSGDESVICDGVLYILIYSTGGGTPENRHGLVTYNLSSRSSHGLLIRSFIPVPCPLTCGRLMNLKEKLVMVGGIGKQDRPDIIKGIGIWVLNGKEWQEMARMPHKFFQGFGEFDDVFASSGTDDLIYIQSYGAPALLVFDMNQKLWKWSQKCPVTKRMDVAESIEKMFCNTFKDIRTRKMQCQLYESSPIVTSQLTELEWKDYCPDVFRNTQEAHNVYHSDYMTLLCENSILREVASLGKPGRMHVLSTNDQMFMKILKKSEVKVILDMLPKYYFHQEKYPDSVIVPLFGLHSMRQVGGLKFYFVVCATIIPQNIKLCDIYHLKGLPKGRTSQKRVVEDRIIHKDSDFDYCFCLKPSVRERFLAQINCDCELLKAHGIIEYSLLIGLCKQTTNPGSIDGGNPCRNTGCTSSTTDSVNSSKSDSDTLSNCSLQESEYKQLIFSDICQLSNSGEGKFGLGMPKNQKVLMLCYILQWLISLIDKL